MGDNQNRYIKPKPNIILLLIRKVPVSTYVYIENESFKNI